MVMLLDAREVQARLKLRSRCKALEIMGRLPHIDLSPNGARKRNLRIMEDTLDAFCNGSLKLDGAEGHQPGMVAHGKGDSRREAARVEYRK